MWRRIVWLWFQTWLRTDVRIHSSVHTVSHPWRLQQRRLRRHQISNFLHLWTWMPSRGDNLNNVKEVKKFEAEFECIYLLYWWRLRYSGMLFTLLRLASCFRSCRGVPYPHIQNQEVQIWRWRGYSPSKCS